MGQTSQEFTSAALSANYPAYFKALQFKNWCPVKIVLTKQNGQQEVLPPCTEIRDCEACVEVECLEHNGMRVEYTEFGTKPIPLKGTRCTISYDCIRNHPYRILDYGLIVSTEDQAYIAMEMLRDNNFNPVLYETRMDDTLADPRLVFQVIDPGNRWDEIFVNVFGQTIRIRAGHWSNVLPISTSGEQEDPRLSSRLTCYLRYPNEYSVTDRPSSTIFELCLDDIDKEEPMMLPDGQTICVASTKDALQRVMAKHAMGSRGVQVANLANSKMVPKELYDSAVKQFEQSIDQIKASEKEKYDAMLSRKNSEILKMQAERDTEKAKVASLQTQLDRWTSLNQADSSFREDRAKAELADSKAREAAVEAARKDVEHAWMIIKLGGGLLVSVLTFAITVLMKKK